MRPCRPASHRLAKTQFSVDVNRPGVPAPKVVKLTRSEHTFEAFTKSATFLTGEFLGTTRTKSDRATSVTTVSSLVGS